MIDPLLTMMILCNIYMMIILSHPPLGELVDALLRRGPAGLDHVEDALLVGHQARHLAYHVPHHLHALAEALGRQAAADSSSGTRSSRGATAAKTADILKRRHAEHGAAAAAVANSRSSTPYI